MDPVGVGGAGAAFAKRPGQRFAGMLLYDRPEHSAGVPPQGSEVGFERAVGIIGSGAVRHLLRRQLLQFRTILVHMKIGHDASSSSPPPRSEEHTSELQSLMRISYAVFCLTKNKTIYKKY